jgi:hypothetical protein
LSADLNVKPVDSKNIAAAIFLLEVEADEMWSFVGNKDAARELWQKISDAYKQHTNLYDAYMGIIPEKISTQSIILGILIAKLEGYLIFKQKYRFGYS